MREACERLKPVLWVAGVVAAASAVGFGLVRHVDLTNVAMVYLLGIVVIATRGRRSEAAWASGLSVLCFDYFFVPPYFTFRVSDVQYLWTFVVMFTVAMIISHLTVRLREEADSARQNEKRSLWLMEKAKKAEVLAEGERLRSTLLSAVSHDLRTPLAGIIGSVETLLDGADDNSRALLEGVRDESQRLSRLVQNLLDVTRLQSGSIRIEKELYPLEEIVASALEHTQKTLGPREVQVQLPEDLPLVPMDAVLIEQLFINLLENAAKHTAAGAAIQITALHKDTEVIVTVADQGKGFEGVDAQRLFEPFYHGPSSAGAGLGLAICRAIVQAHGGRIWAEAGTPGATFCWTLPLEIAHE